MPKFWVAKKCITVVLYYRSSTRQVLIHVQCYVMLSPMILLLIIKFADWDFTDWLFCAICSAVSAWCYNALGNLFYRLFSVMYMLSKIYYCLRML